MTLKWIASQALSMSPLDESSVAGRTNVEVYLTRPSRYILPIVISPEQPLPAPVPLNLPVPLSPFIIPVRMLPPFLPLWTNVWLIVTAPLLEIFPENPELDDTVP